MKWEGLQRERQSHILKGLLGTSEGNHEILQTFWILVFWIVRPCNLAGSFETLLTTFKTRRRHNPEYHNQHFHRSEKTSSFLRTGYAPCSSGTEVTRNSCCRLLVPDHPKRSHLCTALLGQHAVVQSCDGWQRIDSRPITEIRRNS